MFNLYYSLYTNNFLNLYFGIIEYVARDIIAWSTKEKNHVNQYYKIINH